MYKFVLLILLFFIIVDGIIILVGIDGGWINQCIGIGIGAALGIGGNFEYKKYAQREIKKLEKLYSGDQLLEEVQKRGGGSWKGFWLTIALLIVYITISLFFQSVLDSFNKVDSASINPGVTGLHDSREFGELDVSLYFPPVGLQRSYIHYGTTGENYYSNDEVKSELDSEGNEMIFIHTTDDLIIEKFDQYQISNEEIRLVYILNALKNQEVNELVIANESEWKTGDGDDSTSYLTKTGLTVEVQAGAFENS